MLLALWSINDRLRGGEGKELPLPSGEYLNDLIAMAMREAEELSRLAWERELEAKRFG